MPFKERRKAPRVTLHLLTALRQVENGAITWSGFARTLNLSKLGVLLESPDRFTVDQKLSLELLLDDDRLLQVQGVVVRVNKARGMYRVAVAFRQLDAKAKRMLAKQTKT